MVCPCVRVLVCVCGTPLCSCLCIGMSEPSGVEMYNCTTADTALDFDLKPLSKGFLIPVLGKCLQSGLLQSLQQRCGQFALEHFANHNHTYVISSTMHLYTHRGFQ